MAGSPARSSGSSPANRTRTSCPSPGGEHALLARIRSMVARAGRGAGVDVGIGDDAAVVRAIARATGTRRSAPLVLTTDTMVEGVHFERTWLTPRELGVRAFRAAVSDVAAMGARPLWVLLSLELPPGRTRRHEDETLELVRAVSSEARRMGAALVGGNISGGQRVAVTTTVIGQARGPALLRSGAKPGHLVFVTGTLGGSAAGCRELLSGAGVRRVRKLSSAAVRAYRRPPVRVDFAAAVAEAKLAGAMIDVSDGLLQDLGHVARESRVAIRLEPEAVPIARGARTAAARGKGIAPALELALSGGDDYELAFTAPASRRAAIEKLAARHRTRVTVIGRVERGRPAVTDGNGDAFALSRPGFDHLRLRPGKR